MAYTTQILAQFNTEKAFVSLITYERFGRNVYEVGVFTDKESFVRLFDKLWDAYQFVNEMTCFNGSVIVEDNSNRVKATYAFVAKVDTWGRIWSVAGDLDRASGTPIFDNHFRNRHKGRVKAYVDNKKRYWEIMKA